MKVKLLLLLYILFYRTIDLIIIDLFFRIYKYYNIILNPIYYYYKY